jgi:ankyrin repeat protein
LELFCDKYDSGTFQSYVDTRGHNPLVFAAYIGNFNSVNYMSLRGISLDVEDKDGKSILTHSLFADQFDLAGKLLKRGADINY